MIKKIKIRHLFYLLLLIIVKTVIVDVIRISNYEIVQRRPTENLDVRVDEIQYKLANGETEIDWNQLDGTIEWVKAEYDASDFRLVNLVRILYEAGDRVPEDYKAKIEDALFNFRYWWDEPGENSMAYWTENHQILFASAEYLVGQLYPDTVFPSSGLTGKQHMEKAGKRILDWMEMRWNYGFSEFYSGSYYTHDIGGLLNLIDFAQNEEIAKKGQMIMDLLFYDLAAQNINTMFVSVSGRAYVRDRRGGPNSTFHTKGITRYFWGDGKELGPGKTYSMMTTQNYKLPPVLKAIAKDSSNVVIKQSNGLDIPELKTEGYYGTDNRSMMMQWGMGAFTHPEIVRNSMAQVRKSNMFSNDFLKDFKTLDYTIINWLHLEPVIMRILNPQTNGAALQNADTYTYKTKDYSMYTAQAYHPGTYGAQQHIFGMNINNHFSIYHTHPALDKDVDFSSPSYWVGYGHFPHSVQDKNVNLSIYNIPEEKGMMEMDLLDFTHAYFPSEKFDTTFIDGNYVFGKKGETYCAFIGKNDFYFRENATDDIVQEGKQTFWITEAGSKSQDGSFGKFVERIRSNEVSFNQKTLELNYRSNGKNYELKFGADFKLDGKKTSTNYSRYDSPYVKAEKKDETLTFEFNGKSLHLDFENLIRRYD